MKGNDPKTLFHLRNFLPASYHALHAIFEASVTNISTRGDPAVVVGIEIFHTERKLARLSPPSRVSCTPRPRSSFRKATGCPWIANVGSERSTHSLTRAVTRSCLVVGTQSAANGALDPEHQLRLEIRALTSSSRLLSRNHARTCLRPADAVPTHAPGVTERWYQTQHSSHLSGT